VSERKYTTERESMTPRAKVERCCWKLIRPRTAPIVLPPPTASLA
jgi:hypothetical protein